MIRRVGGLFFAIGALAALVTLGAWVVWDLALPTLAYLIAMLMPVGLLLVGLDFVRSARRAIR